MKLSKAIGLIVLAASANGFELLRDAANGFRIGAATNTIHYSNRNYIEAMKSFNYMVAENACKFVSIQGTKGRYNFDDCDNHLKKAQELKMDFRGHALIWHSMAPQWLEREDSNTMKQSIIDHITTVLKHYEGKIDTWDVVNEAIDDGSNGNGWKLRNSFLYQKVPNFIDIAFQTARKVSPNTKLFYNDYNTEGIWAKSESVYQFVADMKKRNIPIDGVGIQYHVGVNVQPQFDKINNLISRYCKLGVEVHITELDVSCDDNCNDRDGGEGKQSQVYINALKACLNNSCCTGFLVWGIGDSDSWRGAENKPLLFNSNYQPKGQYNAILETLKSTPAACLNGQPVVENPTYDVEPEAKAVTIKNGWYYIKNTGSNKYLTVKNGKGAAAQNVEINSTKQKWKVTNMDDNTITLLSELGDYMLDVSSGSSENGANIQIYDAYAGDAQKFVLRETSKEGVYVISTKVSNGYKVLDVEREGKSDGSNVCQWDNGGEKAHQTWVFESAGGQEEEQEKPKEEEQPSQAACWSVGLGYSCCKSCIAAVYTDNDGKWGVENDKWCGIPTSCDNQSTCGAAGYPCCKSSCTVYAEDSDGKWSIENDNWCLIDQSKC
ncbi:hypothetical protein BCR32DRAFT_329626 [Anaeromyces robustus]|jgi:endo-1,4-beta-xylanase|uniref:Beta-xylanase n=1 Tax=Anaeromyces robustus TaxID=1754192 RepID=A0A1Y1WQN5_9FUNG|nr:hypothetical protein BCR32DRAFT_329626 [Anaeromyces robustus]|eukprot:ORX75847.1 hypothetical protein BCR32DRAFT_329626 [Anaeromyces robustus]